MNAEPITLEDLKRINKQLLANAKERFTILSQEQADVMTKDDVSGHKWGVGEVFYVIESLR